MSKFYLSISSGFTGNYTPSSGWNGINGANSGNLLSFKSTLESLVDKKISVTETSSGDLGKVYLNRVFISQPFYDYTWLTGYVSGQLMANTTTSGSAFRHAYRVSIVNANSGSSIFTGNKDFTLSTNFNRTLPKSQLNLFVNTGQRIAVEIGAVISTPISGSASFKQRFGAPTGTDLPVDQVGNDQNLISWVEFSQFLPIP